MRLPDLIALSVVAGAFLLLAGVMGGCSLLATGDSTDIELRQVLAGAKIAPLNASPPPETGKVELGRELFFDRVLSGNRDVACATCHHPNLHTGDQLSLSIGVGGTGLGPLRASALPGGFIPRNAPGLFERGSPGMIALFWDGRVEGTLQQGFDTPAGGQLPAGLDSLLAAQALFTPTDRDEMRGYPGDRDVFGQPNELALLPDGDYPAIWRALMQRLVAIPAYVDLFADAFPHIPTEQLGFQHAANALASFEQATWTLHDSPWDRYLAGDREALTESARRGALLFYQKAGCAGCHSGSLMTDQDYHNLAVPQLGPGVGEAAPLDLGRYAVSGDPADRFAFRTPPLRNVALTGPWMHNGAFTTLEAAVRHHLDPQASLNFYQVSQLTPQLRSMARLDGGTRASLLENLDPLVASPRMLANEEIMDLLAFLQSLTSPSASYEPFKLPETAPSGLPVDR